MSEHLQALLLAGRRLASRPLGSLLSALVIAIALTLPALGWSLGEQLGGLARDMTGRPEISVFLKHEVRGEATRRAYERARGLPGLASIRFVPRDEALQALAARGGFADLTGALAENPLPDAFVLTLREEEPARVAALRQALASMPEVALVQLDAEWVERLAAALRLARSASLALALLLGSALVVVTFNTIRLQVLTLRHEISVKLLLGATRSHVRRPFLWFGALQGLLGGALALGLLGLLLHFIGPQIEALAARYSVLLSIGGPTAVQGLALLGFASLLGLLGAALSVRRHIRDGLVD